MAAAHLGCQRPYRNLFVKLLSLLFFPSLYVFNVQAEAEKGETSPISFILNLTFVKLNCP